MAGPPVMYGTVEHRPDAIHLGAYPGLCYAPEQHGEGIRFAHNGAPVESLVPHAAAIVTALDQAAAALGVPFADACDGLKYLRDQGLI